MGGWLLAGNQGLALLIVANVAALVAGMLLHRLALEETGDAALARRAAWFFALFPGAFVLVWGYAEALMLVALIGAFLALRRQAWWLAGAFGLAAGLSRPIGLFLVLPALWEVTRDWRESAGRDRLARVAAVIGAPVGVLSYLVYTAAQRSGVHRPPHRAEPLPGGRHRPGLPPRGGRWATSSAPTGWVTPCTPRWRCCSSSWPWSSCAAGRSATPSTRCRSWCLALSAESFNSLERYGLNAFPLVLALATVTKRPELERAAVALGAAGVVALTALSWVGNYVP